MSAAPPEGWVSDPGDDPGALWSPSTGALYRRHDDGRGGLTWLNVAQRWDVTPPEDAVPVRPVDGGASGEGGAEVGG